MKRLIIVIIAAICCFCAPFVFHNCRLAEENKADELDYKYDITAATEFHTYYEFSSVKLSVSIYDKQPHYTITFLFTDIEETISKDDWISFKTSDGIISLRNTSNAKPTSSVSVSYGISYDELSQLADGVIRMNVQAGNVAYETDFNANEFSKVLKEEMDELDQKVNDRYSHIEERKSLAEKDL